MLPISRVLLIIAAASLPLAAPAQDSSRQREFDRGQANKSVPFGRAKEALNNPVPSETRSITYEAGGKQTTRYFQISGGTNGAGTIVNEVSAPGGTKMTNIGGRLEGREGPRLGVETVRSNGKNATSEYEWMMNNMGYTRTGVHSASRGAGWLESGDVATTRDTRDYMAVVVGPDGQNYIKKGLFVAPDGTTQEAPNVGGPNGESVTHVDEWTQKQGAWARTVTSKPKIEIRESAVKTKVEAAVNPAVTPVPTAMPTAAPKSKNGGTEMIISPRKKKKVVEPAPK